MKKELYSYATSLESKSKALNNVPIVCIWVILSIFLAPILISNIGAGLLILALYAVFFIYTKRKKSQYEKILLTIGSFMLFLSIEFSSLVAIQYKVNKLLLLITFLAMVFYEGIWWWKIKSKFYSKKRRKNIYAFNLVTLVFGGTGIWCGKYLAHTFGNTPWKILTVVFLCSFLFVGSITFFQRYIICKILKRNTMDSSEGDNS